MDRFKTPKKEKINALVQRSEDRSIASFSAGFQVSPIGEAEKKSLQVLLEKYKTPETEVESDLKNLLSITAEIKAISNQAVMLHGQRIKKVQSILKNYSDGAFSAYLMKTYGNRQTPYNFMHYFELYHSLSSHLQTIINEMPRQAIYSLSSRNISEEKKVAFIENYKGETKSELLEKLRLSFPLEKKDKRNPNKAKTLIDLLNQALKVVRDPLFKPTKDEKNLINTLQNKLMESISKK